MDFCQWALQFDLDLGRTVNAVGLVMDIVGALLLWQFGLPEALARDGGEFLWEEPTPEGKKKAKRNVRWSRFAIGLIVLGFLLQLASDVVP
jgi:hypothetical protein